MKPIRSIDLVIPVYDEEPNLPRLLDQLRADLGATWLDWRVIFVDDGSTDRSFEILEAAAQADRRFHVIQLCRNFGQHAAIFAGFSRCEADAVVTLDADLQNPPAEIARLIRALDEGYDVAGGWRRDRRDSGFRRIASRMMNRLVSAATGVPLRDYGCMLRAYRIQVVRRMRESGETSSFIPALAHCFTDRIVEIPVSHSERGAGGSRYSVFGLVSLLLDLLTGFSMTPLRVLSMLGFGMALLGIAFGVLLVAMRMTLGSGWAAEGVFTLFAPLFVFIGAQFVGLGLLGEYIGRIYNEVRRRPQFAVRMEFGCEEKRLPEARAGQAGSVPSAEDRTRPRVP